MARAWSSTTSSIVPPPMLPAVSPLASSSIRAPAVRGVNPCDSTTVSSAKRRRSARQRARATHTSIARVAAGAFVRSVMLECLLLLLLEHPETIEGSLAGHAELEPEQRALGHRPFALLLPLPIVLLGARRRRDQQQHHERSACPAPHSHARPPAAASSTARLTNNR